MSTASSRKAILKASALTTGLVAIVIAREIHAGDPVFTRSTLLMVGLLVSTGIFLGLWEGRSPKPWSWDRSLATFFAGMFAILAAMWAAGEVRERYAQPELADLDAVMASFAEDAVAMAAQRHGIRLDYGPKSMEQVEEILAPLHETHKGGNLSRDEIAGEVLMWGAYVGEVVKRLKGGNWEKEDSPGGGGSLSVVWDGTALFPCRWCGKRILDGPDDNVWAKFRFLVLDEARIDSQPANWPSIDPSPDAGK